MTVHLFHLYGSEEISAMEDKRLNIITKDAFIAVQKVLGALCQKQGVRPNIHFLL